MAITLGQALTIYIWFMAAILLLMLLIIARFFERKTGEQTHYRAFVGPIILFGLASVRSAYLDQLGGDSLANLLWLCGGLLLISLCVHVYRLMTGGSR